MALHSIPIEGGPIQISSPNADGVGAFKGIPYAAPPVGALRWRPPQPVLSWTAVRSASEFGRNCLQGLVYDDIDPTIPGVSEDCLYLNVWTPVRPGEASRLPVLFWIHGGAFVVGSGPEPRYDGARLAARGIVVVAAKKRGIAVFEYAPSKAKIAVVGNGSASITVFDLTTTTFDPNAQTLPPGPTVIAEFSTGISPDYDGPNGIAPCVASANGRAFSDPTCGDLRSDEISIGVVNGRTLLLVANGDPGFPIATIADVTNIVAPTGNFLNDHCLPFANQTPYGPPVVTTNGTVGQGSTTPAPGPVNPPTCILGQIYYDGAAQNDSTVVIDDGGLNGGGAFPCPDPSTTALSGVSGHGGGVNILGPDIPCHHGPLLNPNGTYCASQANPPSPGCVGAVAIAGLGGSAFNPNSGRFLLTNSNSFGNNLTIGSVDVINPNLGSPNGPFVETSFPMPNCMPTSIIQGPGNNFLVGCGDHDGEAFPPNEYIIDGTSGAILATITQVGGVDETWYNPGDNRYYLAARDMPTGPVLGIIDAARKLWLQNVTTNSNSHSIAVDSTNNHVFVPMQAGTICTTQSANGCVGVFAQQ